MSFNLPTLLPLNFISCKITHQTTIQPANQPHPDAKMFSFACQPFFLLQVFVSGFLVLHHKPKTFFLAFLKETLKPH